MNPTKDIATDRLMHMELNVTFNNISVVSWKSVVLVRKPEYPE